MRIWAWVACGSALGGGARFMAADLTHHLWAPVFPWDTLFVNFTGSFLIGFIATLSEPGGRLLLPTQIRQFLLTGFCGGYTTFSIFSLQSLALLKVSPWLGGLNLALTTLTCLLAVWSGHALAARLNQLARI
ncbi:CrcB family protein [Geoalkalibacter halelectricus]|uniref:Fluoride-specific ion channel FluC n=1 Tax=Geoalkalibacter halelectricus TaxID=2847045 RepID=A0ABY5ZMX8_9BACT|nr:CrcB family protein [Geoalkalibacter halelectricus]MDO3379956.1 CrcB family protein [Geoalkalibacter halelectricus]UWZ80517.1 CrcB family protein [Geoalkalibacter halelectricus]